MQPTPKIVTNGPVDVVFTIETVVADSSSDRGGKKSVEYTRELRSTVFNMELSFGDKALTDELDILEVCDADDDDFLFVNEPDALGEEFIFRLSSLAQQLGIKKLSGEFLHNAAEDFLSLVFRYFSGRDSEGQNIVEHAPQISSADLGYSKKDLN